MSVSTRHVCISQAPRRQCVNWGGSKAWFLGVVQSVVRLRHRGFKRAVDSFDTIPLELRVDADWLQSLRQDDPADVVIELQPVLGREEADRVLRAIADLLVQQAGEKLTGTGTDFSGRYWFRGKATKRSVRAIAKDFFSVQAIHSPLYSLAAAKSSIRATATSASIATPPAPDLNLLPCVAVVDMGVPANHARLKSYRRGQFVPADAPRAPVGDHGSFVASRVVFGDCDSPDQLYQAAGRCAFYDAMVAENPHFTGHTDRVNDKLVLDALRGVRGAAPDVRVFNLSFGDTRPLSDFPGVERREKRLLLQDLDNFVFATDSTVVVAAGNSEPGVIPNPGAHRSHPVIDRPYKLSRYKPGNEKAADGNIWLLELSYDEVAPYPPGMDFEPRQRVAFAAELFDVGESQVDPQPPMQALPIATTMTRLSIQPTPIRTPIIIKTRV